MSPRTSALPLALLALVLAAGPVLAQPSPAPAGEEGEAGDVSEVDKDRQGPLRERVRPVSGHLFTKKGRFEISPSATVSLRDAFFTKYVFGGVVSYFPSETLGFALRGGYALPTVAGAAQICDFSAEGRGCRKPSFDELDGQGLGQLRLVAGADLLWAPVYAKLSLFSEYFAHFDLYGIAGATMVQYRGPRADLTAGSDPYTTFGANLGVGSHVHLTRSVTLRLEFRDVLYREKATVTENSLRNQLMFELGVSFFFPTAPSSP